MSNGPVAIDAAAVPAPHVIRRTHARAPRTRFWSGMSIAMLALVLIGFSPTLYLRTWFEAPPVPVFVIVHGAVLTLWFLGAVLQSLLVISGRPDLHRRLGWATAGIGAAALFTSLAVTLDFVPRLRAAGIDAGPRMFTFSTIVWSNISALVAFAIFLPAAIVRRQRRPVHQRLMTLASISMMQPALARISRWPIFEGMNSLLPANGMNGLVLGALALPLLVCALAFYDWRTTGRVHPVTFMGGGFLIGAKALAMIVVAGTSFGRTVAGGFW